ncbi:MAG: menaquinone-dependent protoporphyrinogen IX dehydrogenase [Rhodobacteraceae bacterium]|nr:menaquinone-dependent protoporphyrinogen IX dehydrogenase [Paracoccaceae bacterium]
MTKKLIIYSTTDGHTKHICDYIADRSKKKSSIELIPIEDVKNIDLSLYETIIIGASIRYGKHQPELYEFINRNLEILKTVKASFFSVNAVARKPNKDSPETNPYVKKFLKLSNWQPEVLGVFAGKIDYPKYRFFDKHVIRLIMWFTKGPTDTSGVYEFTDWEKVDQFIQKIK